MKKPANEGGSYQRYAIFVCIFASLGGAFFGYDQGVTGAILVMDSFLKDFCVGWNGYTLKECQADSNNLPEPWRVFTSNFSLLYNIGCVVGAIFAHIFCDKYGRRATIFLASFFFCGGTIWCCVSGSREMVLTARFFAGLGVGTSSFCLPIFAAEVAPAQYRGALSGFMQMTVVLGLLWAGLDGLAFEHVDEGWRWTLGIAICIPAILLFGVFMLPESPRWLYIAKGRDEAKGSLARIRAPSVVEEELDEIAEAIEAEKATGETGWKEVCSERVRGRVGIAMGLQLLQQLTGINAMFVYGGLIFKDVTGNGIMSLLILQIVNVLATIPALLLVDKVGRRNALLAGAIWMSLSMGASGFLATQCDETKNDAGDTEIHCSDEYGYAMVATVSSFVVGFAMSWGPICWIYPAEIFPLNIRAKAVALSTTANWTCGSLIVFSNLLIPEIHIYGLFFLFAGCSLIGFVFVYFLCPETKGLHLEEIEDLFVSAAERKKRVEMREREAKNAEPEDYEGDEEQDHQDNKTLLAAGKADTNASNASTSLTVKKRLSKVSRKSTSGLSRSGSLYTRKTTSLTGAFILAPVQRPSGS